MLRDAVEYAKAGGKALDGGAFVVNNANIFYAQKDYLQPACVSSSKG